MKSSSNQRPRSRPGGAAERVFLVGVEFLSRAAESRKATSPARPSQDDEEPELTDRRQAGGKVPPGARAARAFRRAATGLAKNMVPKREKMTS